jgi:hypothetical protein
MASRSGVSESAASSTPLCIKRVMSMAPCVESDSSSAGSESFLCV